MTERELNTLVLSRDITREFADGILRTRATNARRKMSTAVTKRWERERLARVKPALDLCSVERRAVKDQLRYATENGKERVIAFCETYLQVIDEYEATLRISKEIHDIPSATKVRVFDAWHACSNARGPMLFSKLADILSASQQPESEQ
jgi:aldehyde:ferredoxin oxidoreductase